MDGGRVGRTIPGGVGRLSSLSSWKPPSGLIGRRLKKRKKIPRLPKKPSVAAR
jgi:hypothetical protein